MRSRVFFRRRDSGSSAQKPTKKNSFDCKKDLRLLDINATAENGHPKPALPQPKTTRAGAQKPPKCPSKKVK